MGLSDESSRSLGFCCLHSFFRLSSMIIKSPAEPAFNRFTDTHPYATAATRMETASKL